MLFFRINYQMIDQAEKKQRLDIVVEILDGCLLFPTTWPASLALAPAPRLRPPMVWKLGGEMKGGGRVGGIKQAGE